MQDPVAAISALATKLLRHAERAGSVPIVGKPYACAVLALKTRTSHKIEAPDALLGSHRQMTTYSALGAGLSLRFLPRGILGDIDFDVLRKFKTDHCKLLERHQSHLLKVAHAYRGLPNGPDFGEQLAALKADAEEKRGDLDREASDAWRNVAIHTAKKAITAGTAAAVPALAMLRSGSVGQIATAAVSGTAAAVGVVAAELLDGKAKIREFHNANSFTYLFDAEKLLRVRNLASI
jgi:hypothetical protein